MNPELLVDALERALTEELGLVLETTNAEQLVSKLHAITKDNPRYSSLIITMPAKPKTVFICKRTVDLNEEIGTAEKSDD